MLAGILCPPARSGSLMRATVDPDPPPTLQSRYCSSLSARNPQAKAHPVRQDHMETSSSSQVCDTVRTCPELPPHGRPFPPCFPLRPQRQVPLFSPSQTELRRRKLRTWQMACTHDVTQLVNIIPKPGFFLFCFRNPNPCKHRILQTLQKAAETQPHSEDSLHHASD